MFNFLRHCHRLPTVSGGPSSSISSSHLGVVSILIISHSNKCVVIAHIGFDIFTKWLIMLRGFICTYLLSSYLLEMSVHMPCLCLNLVFLILFIIEFWKALIYPGHKSFISILIWKYFAVVRELTVLFFRKYVSRNPALYFWWSQCFFFLWFMLLVLYLRRQPKVTKIFWYIFF